MYTRKGDRGETSLYGPRRVSKDSARVEAYGTIDELNSAIGVARSLSRHKSVADSLLLVQGLLFVAGADAANDGKTGPRISASDTARLEEMTDGLLRTLPTLRNFILPGGSELASQLHVARAVCRRAERRIVAASKDGSMNPELVPFFNRLSTYLFDLARHANKLAGKREAVWKSGPTRG